MVIVSNFIVKETSSTKFVDLSSLIIGFNGMANLSSGVVLYGCMLSALMNDSGFFILTDTESKPKRVPDT